MSHQEVGMSSNRVSSTGSMDHQSTSSSTTEPVELHQQVSELQAALEAQTRENALLNEVISTVCSTLKLDEVLRHLVDTIIRAISCHAAFIYLYEKEKERLVLASTSAQYQRLVGKIELALGEGINGWVGMTMQPVILKDEAMNDPRVRYYPELEGENFQSIISTPITSKDRYLLGAITLHTVAPQESTEPDPTFVINTEALVAGAIENAQLYENTQRKLNILTTLSVLSQTISSGLYLDEMLRSLATLTVQIVEADQCVIMLLDQARGRLTVRASSPNLTERALSFQSVDVDRNIWEKLRDSSAPALERLNPLKDSQQKVLLSVPLVAGAEHLGLLNVYSSKTRRYTSEDSTLLGTIANQIAMAIKNSHLVDMLAQKNLVKGFFDDLMYGTYDSEDSLRQRANFLGCDLARPHLVTLIEISQMEGEQNGKDVHQASTPSAQTEDERLAAHKRISSIIRRRIQDSYPGSVVHEHENLLTCILCLSKDPNAARLKTWLRDLSRQ